MSKVSRIVAAILAPALLSACANSASFRLRLIATDPDGGGDAAISPDGRSLIVSSQRSGNWDLWKYDLDSEQWTQVTRESSDEFEAQWSPDGQYFVFTSTKDGNKDVYVMPAGGGPFTQITKTEDDEEYPQWSTDGRQIVYTGGIWTQQHFYVVSRQGGVPRRVTRAPGRGGACSFAPDDRSLVCHRYDTGRGDVVRIDLESGEQRSLTTSDAWDYKPITSPDGKWIAFSRSDEGPSEIWVMPAEGGEARRLTFGPHSDRWPGFAGSDAIAFHRVVVRGSAIVRRDRKSGRSELLVGAEEEPLQASLDRAGRRLVYCARRGERKILRIRELASGETRELHTGAEEACYPRWSPDGETIAFAGRRARWEISTIHPDGSGETVWTTPSPELWGMDGPIDWSPDGRSIVFQADTRPFEADLFELDTRSGTIENLTQDAWFDESPSWSADGKDLLFMSTRGGGFTWGLFRRSAAGAVTRIVEPDYTEKNYPSAGPHGEVVWTFRGEDRREQLMELTTGSTAAAALAGVDGSARWPSYSADGNNLIYSTVQQQVEYWIAEHPFGSGSPLLLEQRQAAARTPCRVKRPAPLAAHEPDADNRKSPSDLFRR